MPKKILLVDDETGLVELMKMRLEREGYEVITGYDGQEALDKARKEKPDLIILDLMLPKMDGYKVCGLLKRDARYSKIPVVMFTARAEEEDRKAGEEAEADAYIIKPFEPKLLLEKIKELLER
ncbi:MAG: response regulator [Candidatus Omnitrophota bacterium]|nr:MAG: response regulator [Candidatus Omnitrophota bacterium]